MVNQSIKRPAIPAETHFPSKMNVAVLRLPDFSCHTHFAAVISKKAHVQHPYCQTWAFCFFFFTFSITHS